MTALQLITPATLATLSQGHDKDMTDKLGLIFVGLFDGGSRYPVPFEDAWNWLHYSCKASALRMLAKYEENIHFHKTVVYGTVGAPTHNYFLTTDCFEDIAMRTDSAIGGNVRAFFRAVWNAYLDALRALKGSESLEKAFEMILHKRGCLYLACINEEERLYKYRWTENLQKRNYSHHGHFKGAHSYRLEWAWKAEKPKQAEDTFRDDPLIKGLHRDCEIGGVSHREILHLPAHISMETIYAIAEQAARKSQTCIQHLYVGAANDEKRGDVLLEKEKTQQAVEKEKTEQAEISAKVHIAELDHEFRMEEMRLTRGAGVSDVCRHVRKETDRESSPLPERVPEVQNVPPPPERAPEFVEVPATPPAPAPEIVQVSVTPPAPAPEVVEVPVAPANITEPSQDSPVTTIENFIASGCELGADFEVYGTDFRHMLLKNLKAGQKRHFGT
jgi:hypothetical protein